MLKLLVFTVMILDKIIRGKHFMAFFNSFQLTVLFAAWPFIINWLANAQFQAHGVLYWVGIVAYIIHFGFTVFATAEAIDGR